MASLSSISSLSLSLFSSLSNQISLSSPLYLLYSLLSPMASLSSKNATALTTPKPMAGPPKQRCYSPQLQNPQGRNSSLTFLACSLLSLKFFFKLRLWVLGCGCWCFCRRCLWVCYGYLAIFG